MITNAQRILIDDVIRAVTKSYGITKAELLADLRSERVLIPRHVGMYLARKLTSRSSSEIGRRFGRHHATVLHAVSKIEALIAQDTSFSRKMDDLSRAVKDAFQARTEGYRQ